MRRKLFFVITGLLLFLTCFISSVKFHDYFYEQNLRNNIQKIKVGMSSEEVIEILGRPTSKEISDIPGEYWCYDTNSINKIFMDKVLLEIQCGHLLLEMSAPQNSRVVKVIGF